ncbi:MAG: hypothetical protein H7Y20_17210 [Bryobacteraceae bacterium]|nr:hypothetical protein [Bryobacteraceae bacterium]
MIRRMPRTPAVGLLSRIWPLLFVAFAVAASLYGLQAVSGIANSPAQPNPDQLRLRLDEIRWTLQIVVVAAGLFAAAQAGFSYFNAQAFSKQAEDAVKRIETLREELESRFPNFMEAERMEREASKTLDDLGKVADWRGSYESLDLRRRQRLLTVDSWVAMDMRPLVQDAAAYGQKLYRMAMLYGSKYTHNRSLGGGSVGDVERAEYYLKLASDYIGETYYLLNEIGLLYLEFYAPRDGRTRDVNYREAERLFRKSLLNKSDQQRAHYNLGVLAGKRGEWKNATGHYKDALTFPDWEEGSRPEMECNILYNAACAWARVEHFENALIHLRKAAALGYVAVLSVDRDYTDPEGDFFRLLNEAKEETRAEVREMRVELSRRADETPGDPPSRPGLWKRLNNAFRP